MNNTQPTPSAPAPIRAFWLNATVFLSGAGIMTVELVASRLIARFLGSSLYTWTGVMGVILAGISVGNYIGGRLADASKQLIRTIAFTFFASALACLTILWLNAWAGNSVFLMGLSWPVRISLHMGWVFLLPSAILGMISPMVAKLALDSSTHTGRTIGTLYSWNAMGSIIGTFVTGFYLTAWMGSIRIIVTMAFLLALLGVLYGAASWRCRKNRLMPIVGIPFFSLILAAFIISVYPSESVAKVALALKLKDAPLEENAIFFAETQYQILTVTADEGNPARRKFFQDKLLHSEVDLSDIENLQYPYMRIYDALINLRAGKNDEPIRLLLLGGGGYVFPQYLLKTRPGSEVVVVEIDPEVTRAAQEAFGLPVDAPLEIHHMDARNYVLDCLRRNQAVPGSVPLFDFVVCDSVSDYSVPYQLTTQEFMEEVKQLLTPDGLYIMNTIDAYSVGAFLNAVYHTFDSAFEYAEVISAIPELGPRNTMVFVGSNNPLDMKHFEDWTRRPNTFDGVVLSKEQLADLVHRNGTILLTDDFAPVENLLAPVVKTDLMGRANAAVRAGILAAQKEDYPRAITHFKRALELMPNDEASCMNLSHAQELMGDVHGALDTLSIVVQLYPENVTARNRAAMLLAQQGHVHAALEQWTESLRLNPAQPSVLNNLGALAVQLGEPERAIRYWKSALEYAPDAEILHKNIAAIQSSLPPQNLSTD